ncbi:uncharacterized protein AB9W97_009247 isoform 4-T5 [Spinachia spinachia]
MLLTPFCLLLPCLQVVPDRSQFFRYSSISLRCTDQWNSPGWTVKRKTSAGGVRPCTFGWGAASSGSSCVIRNTYPSDTGGYWCESSDGNRSNVVHITITDRAVLLESPALPVSVGAAVTLRCVAQATSPTRTFHFHKDGRLVASSSAGILTLPRASRSDRGLYACSVPRGGQSLGSWLEVQGSLPPPPAASWSLSVPRLVVHLLVGAPYLLSTILLGLVCREGNRARAAALRRCFLSREAASYQEETEEMFNALLW